MKILFDYNRTLFNPDTDMVFPGVFEVLQKLSLTNELFLITLNRPERQEAQAIQDLKQFFVKVAFVERKTQRIFQEILGTDTTAVVVGDRLEDEIKVGNQLGLTTILIDPKNQSNRSKIKPAFIVKNIKEILPIITSQIKSESSNE